MYLPAFDADAPSARPHHVSTSSCEIGCVPRGRTTSRQGRSSGQTATRRLLRRWRSWTAADPVPERPHASSPRRPHALQLEAVCLQPRLSRDRAGHGLRRRPPRRWCTSRGPRSTAMLSAPASSTTSPRTRRPASSTSTGSGARPRAYSARPCPRARARGRAGRVRRRPASRRLARASWTRGARPHMRAGRGSRVDALVHRALRRRGRELPRIPGSRAHPGARHRAVQRLSSACPTAAARSGATPAWHGTSSRSTAS